MDGQELNPTAASLLGFLSRSPMSGYDLAAAVAGSIGYFWNVTRSQLYREIKELERRGYVTRSQTGAREKRVCTITAAGLRAFSDWIASEPEQELIRYPLLLSVFFGDRITAQTLARWLHEHRAKHEQRLKRYEDMLPRVQRDAPYPALTLQFGIEYEKAVLRWIDTLALPSD
jgi:DNA-binding PadR family transcriptional regulator